jgi:nucleoside-diphosphate-sugar epimerase
VSSIYVPDAGRAVAAALSAPAGTYNVCDDAPVLFAEYLQVVATSLGAPRPWRLPAVLGPMLFGEVGRFFFRSLRVSNRRFKEATGWSPGVTSVLDLSYCRFLRSPIDYRMKENRG